MGVGGHQENVVVQLHELVLGQPLPWPVYDFDGNLLLSKGFVVANTRQRDLIVCQGGTRPVSISSLDKDSDTSPDSHVRSYTQLELMEYLLVRLEEVNKAIFASDNRNADTLARRLVVDIQYLVETCPDRLLGLLLMNGNASYQLIHSLHTAVCCELLATDLGFSREERISLLCGALTHDLGIQKIQKTLDFQKEDLSVSQLTEVHKHPVYGVNLLRNAGIEDTVWLDVVRSHHERLDGCGYPDRLQGSQVTLSARILDICDSYSAMVRRRSHRGAIESKNALLVLLQERENTEDTELISCLIKSVGVVAPGSLIKLKNGVVTVAYSRGETLQTTKLVGVIDGDGKPFVKPTEFDMELPGYQPEGVLARHDYDWSQTTLNALWPPILLKLR